MQMPLNGPCCVGLPAVSVPRVVLTDDRSATPKPHNGAAPHARRFQRARWVNPQLILGALLVLTCVAVTARVVAAADDTVPVMVAARDIGAGQELTGDLVRMHDVQLGDDVAGYLTGEIGDGYVVARDVSGGELLPRSAVVAVNEMPSAVRYVAVALPSAELPAGLAAGSVVDAWVTPRDGGKAKRLVSGVRVTDLAGGSSGALGVDGAAVTATLAIRQPENSDSSLNDLVGKLVGAGRDGRVYLSRLPVEGG